MADAMTDRAEHPYDRLDVMHPGAKCLVASVRTIVAVHADGTVIERLAP